MKKISPVLTILAVLALAGCTTTAPLDLTDNSIGPRVGEASTGIILFYGIFTRDFVADYSIQRAAKKAGITRIATVDIRIFSIPIIARSYTTTVTGE
jgi:hypothetical protein